MSLLFRVVVLLMVLWLPTSLMAQELESDQEWEKIVIEKVGCQLSAPGPLTEKVDSVETGIGKIGYHTFYYQSPGDGPENYFYMLSYCDYPEGTIHSDSTELLEEFFETTMETAALSVDGDLIFSNAITIKDYPGRFWRINYFNDQIIIRTKAYVVENRYYALQTVMHKDRSLNPASDRFLDSFKLF